MTFPFLNPDPAASSAIQKLIIDSFAGGGGASTGIELALGRSPDVAINHSGAALALHQANHPDTLHLNSNIWDVEPREVMPGRQIGLLWASPDCKHFSKAKGGAPRDRNIRDLAWIIVKWAEHRRPDVIIMENVEEFTTWGPVDNDGQPIREFSGQTFGDWKARLRRAGYRLQHRELRACDYGAPTIRKRFFLIARRDGLPIRWPKPTHGDPLNPLVKSGRLQPWRTAAECIDWSHPCPSIFATKAEIRAQHGLNAVRPLAANTLARVARGMKRYVLDAKRPFLVNLTHGARTEDLADPFNTITGAHRGEKATVAPFMARTDMTSAVKRNGIYALHDPLRTQMTSHSFTLVAPAIATFYGHGEGRGIRSGDLAVPLRTVTTENRHALTVPSLMSLKGSARRDFPADAPHPTVLAGGGHSALISPVLTYAQQGGAVRSAEDPFHTVTASSKDQNQVIVPHIMTMRNAGKPFNGADEPTHTITAGGAGLSTVAAFLAQQNNDSRRIGGVNPGRPMGEPISTITGSGSHQTPVAAWLAKWFSTPQDPRLDEPMHTVTTKPRFDVEVATLQAPPFAPEHEARAREVAEFLRAHDAWTGGEFVTLVIDGATFVIVDIGMRMLTPRELFNAQGFPPDYVIEGHWVERDGDWHWLPFPKDVQVSCVGNSVCPDLARALVEANCQHLMKEEIAA